MKKLLAILLAALLIGGSGTALAADGDSPTPVPESEYKYKDYQLKALDYINGIRAKLGLRPVKLDPLITKAAENHAQYIVTNKRQRVGLEIHREIAGTPGFTGVRATDRVRAVGGTVNAGEIVASEGPTAEMNIDGWMQTAYHRDPLTHPETTAFGIGMVGNTAVLNMMSEISTIDQMSVYPYDGQTNVDTSFDGRENPNPLEQFGIGKSGFIISFQANYFISKVKATITDSRGGQVPFYYEDGSTTWFLFPAYSLSYDETYTVSFDYVVKGVKHNKTWSFRTKPVGNNISSIKINGKFIPYMNIATMSDGSFFVPLRDIAERLHAKYEWNPATKTITVTKRDKKVKLTIGSKTAYVNGKPVKLAEAPFMSATPYGPLRFISEAIGAKMKWDKVKKIATIDVPIGEAPELMWPAKAYQMSAAGKMQAKVKAVTEIAERHGYTLVEDDGGDDISTAFEVRESTGVKVVDYMQHFAQGYNNNNGGSSIVLRDLPAPQSDVNKYSFIQEVVEYLSGTNTTDLAAVLMEKMSKEPTVQDMHGSFTYTKVNPSVKYDLNASYAKPAMTWEIEFQIVNP